MLEDRAVPATHTVTTPLDAVNPDDGVLSLREAVSEAASSGDTINFNLGSNAQTMTLTSGTLSLDKSLTIHGPGAGLLAISGNYSRVFNVGAGVQVTLTGLTIRDGQDFGGGGI